ncbi:MAG: class I SAM-dependent methyltransferase [bacterium]|nr:class I SAM-dependent methyltransferase [bacterium]
MKTSWGNVANWYDGVVNDEDSYQNKILLPNILRIVEPAKGKTLLDIACGQGFFSHAMAAKGARVFGIDISPELVEIATKHAGHAEEFHTMSAEDIGKLKTASFDAAFSVLAIQNIEHMAKAFKEASRVLKPGGKLVLVLNHPAFRIPGKSAWGNDDAAGVQYRRVDEYLSESRKDMDMNPANPGKEMTVSFHRPLQAYSKSLANAGFSIARIEEWTSHKESQKGPHKIVEDRARKEIPLFMCLECVKVASHA